MQTTMAENGYSADEAIEQLRHTPMMSIMTVASSYFC